MSLGISMDGAEPIKLLLARMRAGDREAAAEFITTYGSKIRRRVRRKLSQPMRRVFDSQEILSTIGRRLDLYVHGQRLKSTEASQFWALIFKMADRAVIDKQRIFDRLQSVDHCDSDFAKMLCARLVKADENNMLEIEVEEITDALDDPQDQQILTLWLQNKTSTEIAAALGRKRDDIRKRWSRIRDLLKNKLEDGEFD